ncbi:hypothetical protein ECML606-1_000096 [Escherichia phage ECML-606-1]|nr:hypothetical protein ECML606-1_000096 [Escherichia phage ECML-606-1]
MSTYTEQQLADLYEKAISAEAEGDSLSGPGFELDEEMLKLAPNYGGLIRVLIDQLRDANRKAEPAMGPDGMEHFTVKLPDGLARSTQYLIVDTAQALGNKLLSAQNKRKADPVGWMRHDWEDDCRAGLMHHIDKGDPRDVMAYAAFMHYHGWKTSRPESAADEKVIASAVQSLEDDNDPIVIPRGLLGAALGAINHPAHAATTTIGLLKHYAYNQPKKAPEPLPAGITGPLEYAYKTLTPQFMRNHLDCFERYGTLPDGQAAIQAMRIALDGIERRTQQPPINTGLSWQDYKGISDRADVHEAIQNLMGDTTEDNAICLIRAIAEALRPRPRFWVDVHGYQTYLLWSEEDAVKHCNETGGLYVLPLFAGEPINCKLPEVMCRLAPESDVVEVNRLISNLKALPQKYTTSHIALEDVLEVINQLRTAK